MEIAFVDVDETVEINEGFFKNIFKEVLKIDIDFFFKQKTAYEITV